jgi:hypothetical protein
MVAAMARKPKSGLDEQEIIRRRDGVTGAASDEGLDGDAKRALADARLRALAFALSPERSGNAEADQTDDAELVAYLLDALPEQRRIALEEALRGNTRAFDRLMTLRAAFSSQTDERDRRRADDPARKIPRHTVGHVDIRRLREILQFRNATEPRRLGKLALAAEVRGNRAPRSWLLGRMESLRFERGEKAGSRLRNVLQRVRRDFDAGANLVNEAQSFLEGGWLATRRVESETRDGESSTDRKTETLHERLTELLRELGMVASRINNELGSLTPARAEMSPPAPPKESPLSLDGVFGAARYRSFVGDYPERRLRADAESWADAFEVEAGPWTLRLTGAAVPTSELVVSLHGNQEGTFQVDPFVTLVRPTEGFETINLDSFGRGKVALPLGDSVMLLQGDEVWQVRLSFRDRPSTPATALETF